MIDPSTVIGRIVAAALRLAAERPWRDVTLFDIAEQAGVTLADMRGAVSSKSDVLAAFARMIDVEVLSAAKRAPDGQSVRDTIFELVMSRFDALAPHKDALRSIAAAETGDPILMRSTAASLSWLLEAAGARTDGLAGMVRVGGLAAVYASVFRTWLEDDDPGLARTMAALDRRLRRGEQPLKTATDIIDAAGRIAAMFKPVTPMKPAPAAASSPSTGPVDQS